MGAKWASQRPKATPARPRTDLGEICSPRKKAPSEAAVMGLRERKTVTCVAGAWPRAQSQR
jgi:hypothetical protein